MPLSLPEVFAPLASVVAAILLVSLILFIALDGQPGWKGHVSRVSHVIGVLTQGYVLWTGLDVFASSFVGSADDGWIQTMNSVQPPQVVSNFLPVIHCGWPLEALLLVIALHAARLMWLIIRPRECADYLTGRIPDKKTPSK
jgi:hypothetical protein